MATEPCRICESVVPYSDTVHVTVHTKSDLGVVDAFVCRSCYEEHLEGPLRLAEEEVEGEEDDDPVDGAGTEGDDGTGT